MLNKRQEDLCQVFDRTWKANHNDVAKRGREREQEFKRKMFGSNISQNSTVNNQNIAGFRASTLHNNMNNAFNGQRQSKLNNIVKKCK